MSVSKGPPHPLQLPAAGLAPEPDTHEGSALQEVLVRGA